MKKFTTKKFLSIRKEIRDGATIIETCRKYNIGYSTYYNWLNKYELIETTDFKRVKAENTKFMKLIVAQALDIQALRMLLENDLCLYSKKEIACEFFRYHGVFRDK